MRNKIITIILSSFLYLSADKNMISIRNESNSAVFLTMELEKNQTNSIKKALLIEIPSKKKVNLNKKNINSRNGLKIFLIYGSTDLLKGNQVKIFDFNFFSSLSKIKINEDYGVSFDDICEDNF